MRMAGVTGTVAADAMELRSTYLGASPCLCFFICAAGMVQVFSGWCGIRWGVCRICGTAPTWTCFTFLVCIIMSVTALRPAKALGCAPREPSATPVPDHCRERRQAAFLSEGTQTPYYRSLPKDATQSLGEVPGEPLSPSRCVPCLGLAPEGPTDSVQTSSLGGISSRSPPAPAGCLQDSWQAGLAGTGWPAHAASWGIWAGPPLPEPSWPRQQNHLAVEARCLPSPVLLLWS